MNFNALKTAITDLNIKLKREILFAFKLFFVYFQHPKYKIGQRITMWNKVYTINGIYRRNGHIAYDIGIFLNISEKLIDFYNKKKNKK